MVPGLNILLIYSSLSTSS